MEKQTGGSNNMPESGLQNGKDTPSPDGRRQGEDRPMKCVADSLVEQAYLLFPKHMNSAGRLFGGQLLTWLDEIAGIVAQRHSGRAVVTASLEHMDFKAGAKVGDMIFIRGYITYVGKSSMEVRVDSYVENREDGMRYLINTAYFVMVALDQEGHPVRVPGLQVQTISEEAAWELGKKHQELRKHGIMK